VIYRGFVVLSLAVLLAACSVNPVSGERDFVLMSESEELALGRQHSRQVMTRYRAYDNASLQGYIQSVGDRLAAVSHRNTLPYRFTLLDSTEINAFALPGGYIYITRGLLAYLNSEAELAAVLGHELGHVTARHSVRQHSLSTATQVIGGLMTAASGVRELGQVSQLLSQGIIKGYGREHELEADGLGVEYLVRAGYPASAMRKVITILKNQELFDQQLAAEQGRKPRAYHGVFSSHPDNDTRLQEVLSRTVEVPRKSVGRRQDEVFLKRLAGLTYADSEQDGVIRGRTFYHAGLDFKLNFPKGWLIKNTADSVVAITPSNDAFLQLSMESRPKGLSPRRFLAAKLGQVAVLSEKSLAVAGRVGHSMLIKGKTPYGAGKVRIAVIFDDQRAFLFHAAVKEAAGFSRLDRRFLASIESFAKLTRADKRLSKPLKIQLTRLGSEVSSLRSAIKRSHIPHHAEERIKLLNNIFSKGKLKSGDLIKIVR